MAEEQGQGTGGEEQGKRLPAEEHIHRLNEENARRRKENEALRARVEALERAAKQRAVAAARADALERHVQAAAEAGKSVDRAQLAAFVESGHLAVALDPGSDVVVSDDGEARLTDEARAKLDAAIGEVVALGSRETSVVPPPRPSAEPPVSRGRDAGSVRMVNAWDTQQAVSLGDRGRKELRDAALMDEGLQDAIDRL
jgi:hypothetical protein